MTKYNILNTRPQPSNQITLEIFEQNGFNVINFPCIEITAAKNKQFIQTQLNNITPIDVVIFTSQNAVNFAFRCHPPLQFTKQNNVIAVGTKTAELLEQHTNADIWVPSKQNSHGVIELLQGINHNNTIQLITAKNGRNAIQEFAQSHSINLHQINVYQRKKPDITNKQIEQFHQTQSLIILATSVTTLINLQQLVPQNIWQHLLKSTIACASERIALYAHARGFENIINTQSANPEMIAKKLIDSIKEN